MQELRSTKVLGSKASQRPFKVICPKGFEDLKGFKRPHQRPFDTLLAYARLRKFTARAASFAGEKGKGEADTCLITYVPLALKVSSFPFLPAEEAHSALSLRSHVQASACWQGRNVNYTQRMHCLRRTTSGSRMS